MKGAYCFLWWMFCLAGFNSFSQENCANGKDDDRDGLIDLRDPDCQCTITVTGNLLQNGSFESFAHCPTYFYDKDFDIINNWRYGTYTDMNGANYYHNLTCSADSSLIMTYIPPAVPLPEGRSFVSIRQSVYRKPDFKETDIAKTYITQCLQEPLKAGEQYTFSFSAGRFQSKDDPDFKYKMEPFSVAVFGHRDCDAVPFGQRTINSNGCPSNFPGWVLLGKKTVQSKGKWVQNRINFTAPPGINVVAIGPDCSLLNPEPELTDSTARSDFYVYYLDDVHLLTTKEFPSSYIQTAGGNPCEGEFLLSGLAFPNAAYQWYKDSIAITGATQKNYRVPKERTGNYTVRITTADTCFTSESFFAGPSRLSQLRLPSDTVLCKGETLTLAPQLNNVTYNWNSNVGSVVSVREQDIYEIKAVDANGCIKNFTVTVQEQDCNNYTLYMPNAFTPNSDGKNDVFRMPNNSLMSLTEFSVYDRWGKKVFGTKNKTVGWNGNDGDKRSPAGTYVYLIKGTVNSKMVVVKGTVTLIR